MQLLNKKEFIKATRAIYKRNKKMLIFDGCYHFSWDAKAEYAEELVFEMETEKKYYCKCCGECIPKKSKKKIAELVKYLNDGGRDEKVMTKLYKDVDFYEWAVLYPGRIVDNSARGGFTTRDLEKSFGFDEMPVWNGEE